MSDGRDLHKDQRKFAYVIGTRKRSESLLPGATDMHRHKQSQKQYKKRSEKSVSACTHSRQNKESHNVNRTGHKMNPSCT